MTPLYIGYFTIGTPYQYEVVECIKTLDAFDLEHEFIGVPNLGDWCQNCAQKPAAIQKLQLKHDGRPLVYIDVDARVRRRPILFDVIQDVDIACHYKGGEELLSGTLYFGATADAREIVSEWCNLCKQQPNRWDQINLHDVLANGKYKIHSLPPEYVAIFDAGMCMIPVIEHMQASRRFAGSV